MAIYLKKFETQTAYEAAESSLILPNVSLTVDNNTVHYNPSSPTPPTPSYESVDLGLPSGTLWATMNVGANSITDYGNYYQYGKGADDYSVTSGQSVYEGIENPLAESADTATQVWGGNWHTPTSTQFQELTANTTYEWTTINGVNGGKFTAKDGSGNYIFIPAAGTHSEGSLDGVNVWGNIWSSTPTYILYIMDGEEGISDTSREGYSASVRAVIG